MLGIDIMAELKRAIDEATSVLIVLPETASDKDYLAALQVQRIAPDKIRVVAPDNKERQWQEVFDGPVQKKEFAITIDTTISPVEELRYQKEEEKIVIFLSHPYAFDQSALHFGEYLPAADLIITAGFHDQESADRAIELLPRKAATRHMSLEENGGGNSVAKKLPPSSAALLGRLMVRSREDAEIDTLWTFITREDFTRTGSTPAEIRPLVETFSRIASLPRIAAIFWQHNEHAATEGVLWSSDEATLRRLREELGEIENNSPFVPLGSFANFIDAETRIRKLLRELG
jgi:hypothetical protein